MKLLLKFNLVFLLDLRGSGLAATGYVSWTLLERNAREEIAQNARLLMDAAIAARTYTSTPGRAAARDADEVHLPAAVGAGVFGDRGVQRRCARSTPSTATRRRC